MAADITFKQRIYAHIFFVQILYINQNLAREREVKRGQRMYRTMDEKKEGQMEVRWLLTNRKHGGKTKSVSVLKAALKNAGMGEKNRKVGC